MNPGAWRIASASRPRGIVSSTRSMATPALHSCHATCHSSGPAPASTTRPDGTSAADLSSACTAPAVITPGSVHPGNGTGRSIAPEATITARAGNTPPMRAPGRPPDTPSANPPSARRSPAHTVVAGR